MKVLVATRIPFLVFRRQGRPGAAAAALFLPLTLLLWLLAAFRAMPGRWRAGTDPGFAGVVANRFCRRPECCSSCCSVPFVKG